MLPTTPITPRAIGSIIAAPAVLDMTGEVRAPMRPKARMMQKGVAAHPRQRQHPEGQAPVQPVHHHRLGDDEAADEEHHRVVGEQREHDVYRRVVLRRRRRGLEQGAEDDAHQRGHRDGNRLGHPPDDDKGEDRGEPVLISVEVEGNQQHDREYDGAQKQPDRAALALEALLGLRQLPFLLVECAVGLTAPYVLDLVAGLLPRLRLHVRSDTRFALGPYEGQPGVPRATG
jgi:hypothetical protein